MRKILLPILSTIFSLTTLLTPEIVLAQSKMNNCQSSNDRSTEIGICQVNTNILTPQKWRRLVKKYYRTRYRTKFKENNDFLSVGEVNNVLGFSGTRNKIKKGSHHQYLSWKDGKDPHKIIEAVFVYHQLVGLRSRGFNRSYDQQHKTQKSAI